MSRIVIGILMFSCCTAVSAAEAPQKLLEELLSDEQQEALHLSSLDATQQQALLDLLAAVYAAGKSDGIKQTAASTSPPPRAAAAVGSVIETKIAGEFEGWDGETVIKLLNGQIWQQTEYHYHYHYAYMPDVLIYSSGGGYKMKVEGVEKAISVMRLR